MSRRNNENTPKNKLASNASSQGRRNNRKFQTTIKKKHKFSTFSARDFKEAKKHFNMNKDSNNTSNSSSISNNNGKYTTPSMSRRVGGCRSGNRRSNNNNAWTTAKVNNRNNFRNNNQQPRQAFYGYGQPYPLPPPPPPRDGYMSGPPSVVRTQSNYIPSDDRSRMSSSSGYFFHYPDNRNA